MFGDDVCSAISFEFGGDENGDDGEADPPEMKYVPPAPVKREIEEAASDMENRSDSGEQLKTSSKKGRKEVSPVKQTKRRAGSKDHLSPKEKQAVEKRERRANMTSEEKEKEKEKERLRKQRARALEKARREEEQGLHDVVANEGEEDGGKKRRPRRSVAKVEVKYEVDSEEEKPKKKRSIRRKGGDEDWNGGDDEEEEIETRKKTRRRTSGGGGGGRRKKVDEMTEEEREANKAKWREEARLKRQRQRESMTEAERQAILERQREQKRKKRAEAKMIKGEDEREEENRRARERKKERRALMTPEKRREEAQKVTMRRIERLAGMTEDEKKMWRMSNYLQSMAREANMSEEMKEERRRKMQENWRRRKETMTEEDKERLKNMQRSRRRRIKMQKMSTKVEDTEEQKDNRLMHQRINRAKRAVRKRLEKKGADAEEIEWKVRELENNYQFKPSRRGPPGETEEEKRKRISEQRALTQRKTRLKKKLEIQKLLESGLSLEEITSKQETPQQRENRLFAKRRNKAKHALRRQLENIGTSPSEIQRRLQELEATYQSDYTFREYKPRPSKWKPIDPSDLALLSEQKPFIPSTPSTPSPSKSKPTTSTPKKYTPIARKRAQPSCSLSHPRPLTTPFSPPIQTPHYPQQFTVPSRPSTHHYYTPEQNHPQIPTTPTYPHDYSNSYADDSGSYSPPPASPPGGEDENSNEYSSSFRGDYFTQNTYQHHPQSHHHFHQPVSSSSNPLKKKRNRPSRKKDPSIPRKPRFGPRGALRTTKASPNIPTEICDECGNSYKADYLREHKNQQHNPNFKNQTCLICGDKFSAARAWYTHYNKQHKYPEKLVAEAGEKEHMCDHCGMGFKKNNNLTKHKYFMHGDGLKKENYKRCPVCPEEILFKENISLNAHLKRKHPEYRREAVECFRCEERFPDEATLEGHVKECHVESYWPCEYCNACRFTQLGLHFHYKRCKRVGREKREELRQNGNKEGVVSLDGVKLPCLICERNVAVFSLTRHYWEMHNVRDGGFMCPYCGKEFKAREFWAVHMEEKHEKSLEQMRDLVRGVNVGVVEEMEVENKEERRRGREGQVKRGDKRRRGRGEGWGKKRGGKGRRVVVIAEEDEEIERRTGVEFKKEEEEESEDEEEGEGEWRGSEED